MKINSDKSKMCSHCGKSTSEYHFMGDESIVCDDCWFNHSRLCSNCDEYYMPNGSCYCGSMEDDDDE